MKNLDDPRRSSIQRELFVVLGKVHWPLRFMATFMFAVLTSLVAKFRFDRMEVTPSGNLSNINKS
jgi:hypothetical protein